MFGVTKYTYENFGFPSSSEMAAALDVAQREAQIAKEIAEKIIEEAPPEPTFSEAELEQAKKLAYEQGKQDGIAEAREMQAKLDEEKKINLEELLKKISSNITEVEKKAEAERKLVSEKLSVIAFAAAKKVVHNMPDSQLRQIENFIEGALGVIKNEDDLQIALNPETAEAVRDLLSDKYPQFRIKPDASLAENDYKIIWDNGYAEQKLSELWKDLEKLIIGKFDVNEFDKSEKVAVNVDNDSNTIEN